MFFLTELGARLKEARLSKGYSLDDLQEVTKIQKRYLVGIEEGNYSIMPGSFYVRAFIKQYAEAVGLNPEDILTEYQKDIPGAQKEEVAQSYTKSPSRHKMARSSSNKTMEAMPKVIIALFAIMLIVVSWVLFSQRADNTPDVVDNKETPIEYVQTPTPEPTTPVVPEEEEPAEEEVVEEPTPAQVIGEGAAQGETTTYEVSGAETLTVRIEVSGDTWVGIRSEQAAEQIEARVYKTGEVIEQDSTENGYARIRLGNANVAKVFVNGEELAYVQDRTTQNIILKLVNEEQ